MKPITYITLFFAPAMAAILYFYLNNKNTGKFGSLLVKSYFAGFAGALILVVALTISGWIGLNDLTSLKRTLFYTFITVGFSSELGKYLLFRYYIIPHREIDRPLNAITYSVMITLGFATITLLFYFLNFFKLQSVYPSTMYPFIYIPANLIFAVIMGFFVGFSRFLSMTYLYSIIGLFGAAFFHGIFKFCLVTHDFKLLTLFAFGSCLIVLVLIVKATLARPETLG
ncbi:MAG: PrsW family glutamic-type intramembrane protease [Bacteroidetes bacterium]|nr:PrsW family glutamic-type intramembrane protease [Bacteroidota bacterium]